MAKGKAPALGCAPVVVGKAHRHEPLVLLGDHGQVAALVLHSLWKKTPS